VLNSTQPVIVSGLFYLLHSVAIESPQPGNRQQMVSFYPARTARKAQKSLAYDAKNPAVNIWRTRKNNFCLGETTSA
jgi:hypothetical protein